jgi:arylformamidase
MTLPTRPLNTSFVFALSLILSDQSFAQSVVERFKELDKNSDARLDSSEAGTLGFFKLADIDGDGLITLGEAQSFARKSVTAPSSASNRQTGLEGDGAAPIFHWPVAPVKISESDSPLKAFDTKASDGRATRAWFRKPKGDGPFPTIIFIHGGLTQFPDVSLRQHLTDNPVITRFIEARYAVVMTTFRTYEQDVQSRGPIEDVRAVLQHTAKLPGVDPRRIVLYGGSGGGSIALELGGDPEVRAVVAGEPATVLYTGMLTTGQYGPRLEMMASPEKYFTPELRQRTLAKLKSVRVPVLVLHGDRHDLHKLNKPLFLPLMKEAGIEVAYREYPGYGHGFYFGGGDDRWGKGADEAVVEQVVADVRNFLRRAMPEASNSDAVPDHHEEVVPTAPCVEQESLAALDRYRLWVTREIAIKRQDIRAIEKLSEISRRIATSSDWNSEQNVELRKLLEQLEARLGVSAARETPLHLQPNDYPFAVPRRELLNVGFAKTDDVDANMQSLDVHAPAKGSGYPIVVWLHGGGMRGGDKSHPGITVLKPDFFISRGYVFASLNYRLAPAQKHPAQAEDTAAAIAWLHDHAVEFGGDPNRIFLIGISAGAQLASVISTNERFLAKHLKSLDIIQAAVILDIGSFDIPTLMEQAGERAAEMYRYTFRDGGNREDWIDCSPYYHVQRGKGIPPMLLYYVAGRDHHAVENQRFVDRLTAEGYEATVLAAEGKTHLSIELEIGITGDIPTAEILKFIKRYTR